MHWGIRRYQNKDGSWTKEGKEHQNPSVKECKKEYRRIQTKIDSIYDEYGMDDYPEDVEAKWASLVDQRNKLVEGPYSEAVWREYANKKPDLIRNHTGERVSWTDAFGTSYEDVSKSQRHSLTGLAEGGAGQYRFANKWLG